MRVAAGNAALTWLTCLCCPVSICLGLAARSGLSFFGISHEVWCDCACYCSSERINGTPSMCSAGHMPLCFNQLMATMLPCSCVCSPGASSYCAVRTCNACRFVACLGAQSRACHVPAVSGQRQNPTLPWMRRHNSARGRASRRRGRVPRTASAAEPEPGLHASPGKHQWQGPRLHWTRRQESAAGVYAAGRNTTVTVKKAISCEL